MLTGVVFALVTTPKNNTIEAIGPYKCLYIQVISKYLTDVNFGI